MEYYQTEGFALAEGKWTSCRDIVKSGDRYLFIASERLTIDQAEAELARLKKTYKAIEFQIAPFDNSQTNG